MLSSAAAQLEPGNALSAPSGQVLAGGKHKPILCLLLFAVTLGFYNPIAHDGFVLLDDVPYILENPHVKAGITWDTVKWSFTHFHAGYWHPLTWLSHALDCQLFGLNPAGHHYVSLLFHAANAVLLFLLLEEATALLWPSLLVGLFFAIHPVNVESVAWAAERKNVLSMFFFLLAMWAYGRYAKRGGVGRYSTVVACFALGMMAKPQIITLPCVLLLWDYWPLNRLFPAKSADGSSPEAPSIGFLILEKIPLFLIAFAGSVITVRAQRSADAVRKLSEFSLAARLENAVVSYGRYLLNLVWPRHLAPLYPHPENSLPMWQVILCLAVLGSITAATVYWRNRRYLAVGWFWFLGVLVPMIGIVQVGEQAMADRFVYIPMIGAEIAIFWVLWEIVQQKKISQNWILVPSAIAALALGGITYHQLGYWKDGETLWTYTLSVTDKNYMAHQSLAMVLDRQGRVEEAIPHFRAAEALHNFPLIQVLNLGIYEQRNGHVQDAIGLYQKVLGKSADPKLNANAWNQIATAEIQEKDYDHAQQVYERALQMNPSDPAAMLGTGLLAERSGQTARAAALINKAVNAETTDVGLLLLADALQRDQKPQDAAATEDLARKMSPDFERAREGARQTLGFFGVTSSTAH